MTSDRERRIEWICQAALERESLGRSAFVAEACAGDAALQRDVESLLAQEPAAAGFMSKPAAALVGGMMSDDTSFIGRHLGPYVIQARLGAGGMGEVYRAHDTKLGRDVAIKILPRIFMSNPERLARFDREARLLASLNHPNIGAIYGLEAVDGVPALILELVDGETLADRLARPAQTPPGLWRSAVSSQKAESGDREHSGTGRSLPVPDALAIASQIAAALEAAHERGIVHRDLKPANIVVHDLAVKVLDFGLAKAVSGDAAGSDPSQSPEVTASATAEGLILGTAAYMSPGQARGRPVDKRADVWAFGCVLFEMLTGRLAFPGDTVADTIASILEREPDWGALPDSTPAGIRRLLHRCLEKDPTRRLRDIGDARLDVDEALNAPARSQPAELPSPVRRMSTRALWALAAVGTATVIGVLGVPSFRGTRASDEVRFTLAAPLNIVLPSQDPGMFAALSPDGRRVAFVGVRAGTRQLWVRSLDALDAVDAQPLPGTEGAASPIWSPDNRTVAFGAQGKLKSIDVDGRSARTLCDAGGSMYGGAWSPDGSVIVFATLRGLFSVPANGGAATPLANPDATSVEARLFPTILPDRRRFVYLSVPSNVAWLGSLDSTTAPVRLLNADSQVAYVEPGYLVFLRRGTLMAQRFDAQRVRLVGEAVPIAEGVMANPGYGAAFATSGNGVLVYRRDPQNVPTQLTWADRSGRRLATVGSPGRYINPELSPDGTTVVMEKLDAQSGSSDIWRLDVGRGVMTSLTSDPGSEVFPIWSPDGTWIVFASNRGGLAQLYRVRANGTGGEERVSLSPVEMLPQSWTPDGQLVVYQSRPAFRLGLLPLREGGAPRLFDDSTKSFQGFGQVSPDGHWLTYASTESAQEWDIYVQSFPMPGLGKYRVSADWGSSPRWGRDGREIFYYARDGQLMAVPITRRSSGLEFGTAVPLFEGSLLGGPPPVIRFKQQYDVARDGRFLLNVPVEPVSQSFTVVVNWTAGFPR